MASDSAVPIVLILLFACMQCVCSAEKEDGKIKFAPLPETGSYKLDGWSVRSWGLSGLVDISTGLALLVKPNAPYDIIGNVFSAAFGKSDLSVTGSQVLDYETPLIVLAALSLVCALLIPIIGLIFCCCRCAGHCGGDYQAKMVRRPTKSRCWYMSGLSVCAFFLILGGAFILASSVKMNESLEDTRLVWMNSFEDVVIYKSNTFKELNHIAGSEVASGLEVLMNDVVVLAKNVIAPVINEGAPLVNDLVKNLQKVSQGVSQALSLANDITTTANKLVNAGSELRNKLAQIKKDLSNAASECSSNNGSSCNEIPSGDVITEADFTKVPDLTNTTTNLEKVEKVNLTDEAIKGNDSFHEISNSVANLTSNLTQKFENISSKVKDVDPDVLQPLEDKADEFIKDNIIPFRDDIDSKYLGKDGLIPKYDKYRHVFFSLLGSLILIDAFLIVLGVLLGLVGSNRFDTPGTRSRKADLGGRILIGAAGMFFFSIFFINLSVGVLFLVGSNIAVVCEDVSNLELWRQTLDNPKVMGEYPLSKILFKDGSINLQLSQILSECQDNKAPWEVFRLDNLFNMSTVLNYKNELPALDSVFGDLNSTITDTEIVTNSTKKSVQDAADAGVQHINYTQYHEQTNKPIVNVSLVDLAENVSSAANATGLRSTSRKLNEVAKNLTSLHKEVVMPAQEQSTKLASFASQLEENGRIIGTSVQDVQKNVKELSTFMMERAPVLAAQAVVVHGGELFNTLDYFLLYVTNQVESEVGRCRVIRNIYNGLTGSLCREYGGGLNASWVGFGICSLTLLVSIIFCVRASKLLRRVPGETLDDVSVDVRNEEELLQLPWMDDLSMGSGNTNLVVKSVDDVKI